MRRKDREMSRKFALEILDKCVYATLATVNSDQTPYCVPITIVREGEYIYFHCAHEGQKAENLKRSAAVCISCVGDVHVPQGLFTTEYESAVAVGQASEMTDEGEKLRALGMLCRRHTPQNMHNFEEFSKKSLFRTAVWRVKIESLTGKRKKYDRDGKEMKFGRMQ